MYDRVKNHKSIDQTLQNFTFSRGGEQGIYSKGCIQNMNIHELSHKSRFSSTESGNKQST